MPSNRDEGAPAIEAAPSLSPPERAPGIPVNSLTSYDLGALRVMRSLIDTSDPSGTAAFIPWDWADQAGHLSVRLVLQGEQSVDFGGRPVALSEGDLCVCEPGHPLSTEARRCELLTIALERDRLDNPRGSLHGLVLRGDHPLGQLLGGHLHRLVLTLPGLTLDSAASTVHVTLSLLHTCLGLQCRALETAASDPLRARIIAFIESHVHAQELSTQMLQQVFHVSRARLYRVLQSDGGVARVIARARTDAAFRDIRNRPDQPLLKVAERWGFSNLRQFQRAFRTRFGFSPGTLRQPQWRARADAPAPPRQSVQALPARTRAASSAK
ncbi:MAG TPA: helix-turn-helix domain-containing protein [Rhodanobacteraceae bacterium]|nr:helix-turn-helix domain-containing protein [Rhodanobacteraceae bacterium]